MSSNQETMRNSIKTAENSKKSTAAAAVTTYQTTIEASNTAAGYRIGFPTNAATYTAAVATANQALRDARYAAEMTKQCAVEVAKDILRGQSEVPF